MQNIPKPRTLNMPCYVTAEDVKHDTVGAKFYSRIPIAIGDKYKALIDGYWRELDYHWSWPIPSEDGQHWLIFMPVHAAEYENFSYVLCVPTKRVKSGTHKVDQRGSVSEPSKRLTPYYTLHVDGQAYEMGRYKSKE